MKKLVLALLAGALVLSFAMSASATELKTYGYFRAYVSHVTSYNFDDNEGSEFTAAQRLRPFFDFVANENLKATLGLEFDTTWGKKSTKEYKDAAGASGMDIGSSTELKRAMVTFKWPETDVLFQIGAQGMGLPTSGVLDANPVFAGDVTGAVVSIPVNDMFGVTLGWARPWLNQKDNNAIGANGGEAIDALFLVLPVKMEGVNVTPYFVYGSVGQNSLDSSNSSMGQVFILSPAAEARIRANAPKPVSLKDDANIWYAGLSYKVSMFDPISVYGDIIYGKLDTDEDAAERSGWFVTLGVDYKMDMMTPSLYGYYSTGDDDDPSDGSETIPILVSDQYSTPAGFAFGARTTFAFNDNNYALADGRPKGMWLIGFALKDISLVENLKSTFAVEYGKGTSDKKAAGSMVGELTEEDSFVQAMLNSKYNIYENLAAVLELGYAKLDMDEDVWGKDYADEPAYLVTFGFTYDF